MARKRKLQQRVKKIGAQIEASIREDGEQQRLQHVASEELFQIDTQGGGLTKKQKLQQKDPVVKSKKFVAEKANKFEVEAVKKLAKKQQQPVEVKPSKKTSSTEEAAPLWGSNGIVPVEKKITELDAYVAPAVVKKIAQPKRLGSTKYKVKSVAVAAPGQSYNPDFEAHQDVLAEAVAQELEKEQKRKELSKPVSSGLSEETLQFIKQGDSDDDNSEDDDDEEGAMKKRRAREKLTQSQRNKRARHKQMEMDHKVKRGEKSLVKQINASNHILQKIIKDEKASEQKQEIKKLLLEQKLEDEPLVKVAGQLTKIERDTPVLLSDELTGSLRTLRPRGNPLLDRFDSLHKRNMIEVNHSRKKGKRKVRIIEVKK